jgi:ankyrin repeat protein
MRAIHGGFPEIAVRLIAAGADVGAANRYGVTALYLAARAGDAAGTRALLAAGASANTSLPEGETALMTAAKAGQAAVVRTLLTGGAEFLSLSDLAYESAAPFPRPTSGYGSVANPPPPRNRADVNAREGWYGQTALMWAAAEGHADVVRLLLEAGAKVDERSREIDRPESYDEWQQGSVVYPDIPRGGLTALQFAAREGHLEVVQALIDGGADLDAVDAEGKTALLYATLNDHLDVAALLLDAGAAAAAADVYGRTVLFAAANLNTLSANARPTGPAATTPSPIDIVKLALAKGADPNAALTRRLPGDPRAGDTNDAFLEAGTTPFFRAAMSSDLETMSLLLAAGADPLATTRGETTSLMAAAGVGSRESISRGRESDALQALELLLARGADINAANQMGDTALHGATLRGSTAIIQFLADHGANVRAKNAKGQTPLDIAMGVPDDRIPYNEAAASLLRQLTQRS